MFKSVLPLAGAAVLFIGAGCTHVATFDYSDAQGTMMKLQEPGRATKTVAVAPFMDQRGIKYFDPAQAKLAAARPAGDHGSFYLGFLPLLPAGHVEKEEPEKSWDFVSIDRFHFDLARDLTDAAVLSLKASNLFASVARVDAPGQAWADYTWRGKVTNTYYTGSIFSYCITYFASPVLWVLGAPSGVSSNELWVTFELVDNAAGEVVWSYDYRGRDYIVHWIYARNGRDVSLYPQLMKRAMNGALYDLSVKMPELGSF